jgi:putative endonuclease
MISLLWRLGDVARRRARPLDAGRRGEDLAHRYLERRGCTVVARNWRPRSGAGELDMVAWHGPALVFVEVKTRSTEEFGPPDRAVDPAKRTALVRVAGEYLRHAGVTWEQARFDLVSVTLARPVRVEWQMDAFRPDDGYNR